MRSELPLRVLMTADSVGGVWRHALDLAGGLDTHACEIHLVVFGGKLTRAQRREAQAIPRLEITESNLRLEWMQDPWPDVARSAALLRHIASRFDPHVLHLNSYALAAEAWELPVVVGAHSCVCSWWQAVKGEQAPSRYDLYRRRVAAGLSAASMVVAPTRAMLDALRFHHQARFSDLVIPNGAFPGNFRSGPKKPRIFSAGRLWDEAKNIPLLESIASRVEWRIRVAGPALPPEGSPSLPSLPHVQCLGPLAADALRQELSEASIYAAPARYEPFGLAILEAALSECALVLSDLPALRELWNGAAIFVPPDDPAAWAHALNLSIREAESRHRLAARSRHRAMQFSARATADKFYALYARLVRAAERPREKLAA